MAISALPETHIVSHNNYLLTDVVNHGGQLVEIRKFTLGAKVSTQPSEVVLVREEIEKVVEILTKILKESK